MSGPLRASVHWMEYIWGNHWKLVFYSQGRIAVGRDRNRDQSLQQETPRPHEVMVVLGPVSRTIAGVFLGIRERVAGIQRCLGRNSQKVAVGGNNFFTSLFASLRWSLTFGLHLQNFFFKICLLLQHRKHFTDLRDSSVWKCMTYQQHRS